MKQRVREIKEQGDRLFTKRSEILNLWQTIAENFCPHRADFTVRRTLSYEPMQYLMTCRPVLACRDLGSAISAMLRPRGQAWFHARTDDELVNNDAAARKWLDNKSDVMRRVMYDPRAKFMRATKEGDSDFVAFGQAVISIDQNSARDGIIYRHWHLRDTVWCEDAELNIDRVDRNWKCEAVNLTKLFPKTVSSKVQDRAKKEPYSEINCRHVVLTADNYDLEKVNKQRFPFVSIYIDCENETILEEVPRRRLGYIVPRWLTIPGSQYAHSPATVVALHDARMLQQITLTLLEAGQKAVDPPLKATQGAIAGAVNMYAGGLTWVDYEYDERGGAALEPVLDTSKFNFQFGLAREQMIEELISEAFYLNKLTLPEMRGDMTAFEVQKRIEEYIRSALPLFEPIEVEYNSALCEDTWSLAMDMGAFGPMDDMPQILGGRDVQWQFDSPLQAANERAKAQAFMESVNLLKIASEIDPAVRYDFDIGKAFRQAALGSAAQSEWIVPEEQAQAAKDAARQQAAMQSTMMTLAQGGAVAKSVGEGAGALQQLGQPQANA